VLNQSLFIVDGLCLLAGLGESQVKSLHGIKKASHYQEHLHAPNHTQIAQTCNYNLHLNCTFVRPVVGARGSVLGHLFCHKSHHSVIKTSRPFQVIFVDPVEKE
jgi:hypothetical protein